MGRSKSKQRTCRSKSVCSNRGPVMASLRGRWLRDQISFRLGACGSSAGTWLCVLGKGDSVDVGATALSSSLRAVIVSVRRAMVDSPRADRKQVAGIILGGGVVANGGVETCKAASSKEVLHGGRQCYPS